MIKTGCKFDMMFWKSQNNSHLVISFVERLSYFQRE